MVFYTESNVWIVITAVILAFILSIMAVILYKRRLVSPILFCQYQQYFENYVKIFRNVLLMI